MTVSSGSDETLDLEIVAVDNDLLGSEGRCFAKFGIRRLDEQAWTRGCLDGREHVCGWSHDARCGGKRNGSDARGQLLWSCRDDRRGTARRYGRIGGEKVGKDCCLILWSPSGSKSLAIWQSGGGTATRNGRADRQSNNRES